MRRLIFSALPALLTIGFVLVSPGCGSGTGQPVPVHGKICYRGVPVPTGTIVFTPDVFRGCEGPLARAEIQRDGTYMVRTQNTAGASAGWYRITVSATADPGPATSGDPFRIPRSLLPEKYRDPELSGLIREVKADRANCIDFNLD
jgi:hypothetical protein